MIAKNQAKFDVWVLGSSDAMPTSHGWDVNIINSIANAPSTIFFGGGPASRANKVHGPFPEKHIPIYWVGTDDFPVASEKAIKTLQSLTKAFPGWTAVGDTWHIDGFFGEIVRHLWNIGRNDMFIEIPQFFKERNPRGWLNNPDRETARYKVLVSFFNKDKQAIFEQLAKRWMTLARRTNWAIQCHEDSPNSPQGLWPTLRNCHKKILFCSDRALFFSYSPRFSLL